jgi:hypothetical protein
MKNICNDDQNEEDKDSDIVKNVLTVGCYRKFFGGVVNDNLDIKIPHRQIRINYWLHARYYTIL